MIRSIRYITLLVLLQFVTGISVLYAQSITSASGIVRDSVSGEPLSYVSVMFENSTIGAMTDDDGAFSLQNDKGLTRLVVSSLGYDNKVVNLKAGQKNNALNVLLRPTSFEIAEVVVKPKREKYSRKDNPAVELIKKVIEHKNDNRIEAKDEYQSEVYEKLSMSLDDFNPNLEKNKFLKKFKFIKNYLDTSEFNGKPILTISVRETISDQYYRKHPKAEKTITKAKRQQGIDKTLDDGGAITSNLEEIFKGVNIFDNNINILLNRFVSPLSSTLAVSYYKYYIMDTVDVAGDKCVDLAFVPVNSQSYGFMQLYTAPRQMGFIAASAILIGGASTSRCKISHVIIGTFLFQGVLTLGMPVANMLVPGTTLSETLRILISNGIILYALTKSGGGSRA